jgi:hypothetical protein
VVHQIRFCMTLELQFLEWSKAMSVIFLTYLQVFHRHLTMQT